MLIAGTFEFTAEIGKGKNPLPGNYNEVSFRFIVLITFKKLNVHY